MKAGTVEKAEIDPRYAQLIMQYVIKDVFDALVELITNSDDSYHRLYMRGEIKIDGGPITVQIDRRNKDASLVTVKDRAEGMTLDEMRKKIKKVGSRTSFDADRGFMGRGAKDCAVLGKVVFESIKDDKYYKCEFNSKLEFLPYEPEKATPEIRKSLGVLRGNGTVVSIHIEKQKRIPKISTISTDLPYHFSLRDILAEDSLSKCKLVEGFYTEPLVYYQPKGDLLIDETFEIPDYPGIYAKLKIYKSPEPLTGHGERFRKSGLVIKGERAIHECSFLYDEFEKDPLVAHYFGRLECPHIDQLCKEYDQYRDKGVTPPDNNFCLIIDPNRQKGLRRDHPFTKSLFQIPSERLRALISKDREKEKKRNIQIANEETRGRLGRLAKEAAKFIKQQLEEIEEAAADEYIDQKSFVKEGILIYPTYFKVAIGEQKKLGVYVRKTIIQNETKIAIESENDAISILDSSVELVPHKRRPDMCLAYFRVRGEAIKDAVIIKASLNEKKAASSVAQVVVTKVEEHTFSELLEFEHKNYQIKEGSTRALKLFAKYPEIVTEPVKVEIKSSDNQAIPIKGDCILTPVEGTNFALGEVVVQGRRLNANSQITASVNGHSASSTVKVIDKKEEPGIPIKIDLRDEDYGSFRARWAEHEGQPNLLLISARHKSLSRYLGPSPDYEGQNTPHFKLLLAEIVTESVCRKSLVLEAQERSWEFRWADEKEDFIIANSVLSELHKRMREFAFIAHSVMLESKEFNNFIQSDNIKPSLL